VSSVEQVLKSGTEDLKRSARVGDISISEPKPLFDETIDSILGDEKMLNDNEQMKLWGLPVAEGAF
jgi:hypothetical protein